MALTYYTGLKYYKDFAFMDELNPFYEEYSKLVIINITNLFINFDSEINSISIKNEISNYVESECKRLNLSQKNVLILDNYPNFTGLHESYQVEYGKALVDLLIEGYNIHINTESSLVLCGIGIKIKELSNQYPELHKQVKIKFDNSDVIEDIYLTKKASLYMIKDDKKTDELPAGFFDIWFSVTC